MKKPKKSTLPKVIKYRLLIKFESYCLLTYEFSLFFMKANPSWVAQPLYHEFMDNDSLGLTVGWAASVLGYSGLRNSAVSYFSVVTKNSVVTEDKLDSPIEKHLVKNSSLYKFFYFNPNSCLNLHAFRSEYHMNITSIHLKPSRCGLIKLPLRAIK